MTTHQAAGPLAGFLWQALRALHELMSLETDAVELETIDDIVVFSGQKGVSAVMQAKHSGDIEKTIAKGSVELWKTLWVWAAQHAAGRLPSDAGLFLVTTAKVSPEIALLAKAVSGRTAKDSKALRALLDAAGAAGKNASLTKAYAAWRGLDDATRTSIVARFQIRDAEGDLKGCWRKVEEGLLKMGARKETVERAAQELGGWFHRLAGERLLTSGCRIEREELSAKLAEIHDAQPPRLLPSRHAESSVPSLAETRQASPVFLRQLEVLDADEDVLNRAVTQLHRSRLERNGWLQDRLLGSTHLDEVDVHLWTKWDEVQSRARRAATTSEPKAVGWQIHDECMQFSCPVGPNTLPSHVTCGSYYALSDAPASSRFVRWHPSFSESINVETE